MTLATQGGGGISPTFGAGLWILDYVMQSVYMGTEVYDTTTPFVQETTTDFYCTTGPLLPPRHYRQL